MTEILDPLKDEQTGYFAGAYFRNNHLAHYLKKAETSKMPLGVVLVEVPVTPLAGSSRSTAVEGIKKIIDCLQIQGAGESAISFDIKASEDNRYFMIMRIADAEQCRQVDTHLRTLLANAGYNCSRVAVKSFSPTRESPVMPQEVLRSLEDALK